MLSITIFSSVCAGWRPSSAACAAVSGPVSATLASGLAPSIAQAESLKTLRYVGVADLSVLDPVVTGARPTRNAAYLIFDTLYGLDTEWQAQPQMVAGHWPTSRPATTGGYRRTPDRSARRRWSGRRLLRRTAECL